MAEIQDLLIIGGGINGAAIARAAAIGGHKVTLVEQGDLAQATSSASTKLIHGGLRYLEFFEFKLVRESLLERTIMLRTAPHIVHPQYFILPHARSARPWPIVRIGLLLYDLLARKGGLPSSRAIRLEDPALRQRDSDGFKRWAGFSYWDARVDDARLVLLNALDAADAGADIRTRTRFVTARRDDAGWTATLAGPEGPQTLRARALVNAAGPWADRLLREDLAAGGPARLRLVRGSHIVVPRRFEGDQAYLLQQPDGRIVFAIPYHRRYTLIGTTDVTVDAPDDAAISAAETAYLLDAANSYFRIATTPDDIRHSFAGIRALYDDGSPNPSAVSRDYHLDCPARDKGRLLTVYGGKLTTARHLAILALEKLGCRAGDTEHRPLPGGDLADFAQFRRRVATDWPFLDPPTADRMAEAYGSRLTLLLGAARSMEDLGAHFGGGLTAREIDYMMAAEWAMTADDVLWRRSKLGLCLSAAEQAAVGDYIASKRQAHHA